MSMNAGRRFVVVLRDSRVPVSTHATLEAAADKVYRDRAYARWTIMAQLGLAAGDKMRELTRDERKRVERRLFPSLYE